MRVAIIGGSYAGLCAALSLRCAGVEATVYERSRDYDRTGGGIVVQPDFAEYLEGFGYARPQVVAVPTSRRVFLRRDGSIAGKTRDATFYTGWDTLLKTLRDAVGSGGIVNNHELCRLEQTESEVKLSFVDGTMQRADLVVAADGIGSFIRRQLLPDVSPRFAGYVGYRGVIPEREMPVETLKIALDSFVLFSYPNSHILAYLIPGSDGSVEPGHRRFNWVWYLGKADQDLSEVLTDRSGHTHRSSLAPGEMRDAARERLIRRASEELPASMSAAVQATSDPFVQAIFDLAVPSMVHGRVVLVGDAAYLVRPHTASGTSKAAGDSVSLGHALANENNDLSAALSEWESERQAVAKHIMAVGLRIAAANGLGATVGRREDA
ncbi:MAG: FAD-dependent monooxygenase [Planctomycetota bacterium]